jgi:hypothetical protein
LPQIYAKTFPTEVGFYHGGLHGDGLAIIVVTAERELQYGPVILWIAVNNSSLTSGQMGMKTVPKRTQ